MSQDNLWSIKRSRETISALPQPSSAIKRTTNPTISSSTQYGPSHTRNGPRQSIAPSSTRQSLFPRPSIGPGASSSTTGNGIPGNSINNSNTSGAGSGYGSNNDVMGSAARRRTSFFNGGAGSAKVMSTPGPGIMAPPPLPAPSAAMDADRRSSIFHARSSTTMGNTGSNAPHQSFFYQAPQAAGVPRDPRPLRDRSYQNYIGQELLEYLAQHQFEQETKHTLSQNFLKSPTQKDFNYMFQWLYHRIDPSYRFQKSIDQEVPPILKLLRYPYERGITKSQIAAVGGQNWSTFLGLLHWIMQVAKMLEGYSMHQYDQACIDAGIDITSDHIILDHLTQAYQAWLAIDEDVSDDTAKEIIDPYFEAMANSLEESSARFRPELEELEAENKRLRQEIETIEKQTPDPAILEEHYITLQDDKVKFEEYNANALQKKEKYLLRVQRLEEEMEYVVKDLEEAEKERNRLQEHVDKQGISMQDIDRMSVEYERAKRSVESAVERLEEVKKRCSEREAEASEKLVSLETLVDQYNAIAYQIGLIPSSAINAKGQNYELHVTLTSNRSKRGGDGEDPDPDFPLDDDQSEEEDDDEDDDDLEEIRDDDDDEPHPLDDVSDEEDTHLKGEEDASKRARRLQQRRKQSQRQRQRRRQRRRKAGLLSSARLLVNETTGHQPHRILNLDIRETTKHDFASLRKEIADRRTQAQEVLMKDHDLLESIKEALEEKRNDVEALEHRVRSAQEECEKTKELTTTQKLASDAQIEKLEKELARLRADLSESVQLMEQREMSVHIEYEQLTVRANAMREELHTEIDRILNDVIKFKIHVQKNLDEYEGFVADELERELGSDDMLLPAEEGTDP